MSRELIADSTSQPRPNDSIVPVRKFSITTSDWAASFLTISTPSGALRSSVIPRLLRLNSRYAADSPSLWGGHVRDSSRSLTPSTLRTSAPMSPSSAPHQGPAMTRERSSTRTPSSASGGFGMAPKITDYMGAQKWPPNPHTLGAPRRSRGAPRRTPGYYD